MPIIDYDLAEIQSGPDIGGELWTWKVPEGPHKGKELWQAYRDVEKNPEQEEELDAMLRKDYPGLFLAKVLHTEGETAAKKWESFYKELEKFPEYFGVEDLLEMNVNQEEMIRGQKILKELSGEAITIQDAVELALKYRDEGEPGVIRYLMWHLSNAKDDEAKRLYESANMYLRLKKEDPEIIEHRKKKMTKYGPGEIPLTEGGRSDDPWFNMPLAEALEQSLSWGERVHQKFMNYLKRHYVSEVARYLEHQQRQSKQPKERDLSTQIEEKELQKKRLEQEQFSKPEEIEKLKEKVIKEEVEPSGRMPGGEVWDIKKEKVPVEESSEADAAKKLKLLRDKAKQMREETKKKKGSFMKRTSDAGPAPYSYNAPGKDDREDYDHKEMNIQPARSRNVFEISRMFSTTSAEDNGYIIMEIGWDPGLFKNMSPQNIQHQIISFIKGLESDKYYHDFGIMGKPKIVEFDEEAGVARVKVRSNETRGIMTLTYGGDLEDNVLPIDGIR